MRSFGEGLQCSLLPSTERSVEPPREGGFALMRPSSSTGASSRSAIASSSSASNWRRSSGVAAARTSARGSSMCCSLVILVSLTGVKGEGGTQGGESQVKAREHDRRSRRVEAPILPKRRETGRRESWRGRAALDWLCPYGIMDWSQQTGFYRLGHQVLSLSLARRWRVR